MDVAGINLKAKSDLFDFVFKAKSTVQELTKDVLVEIGRRLVERSPIGFPPSWKRPWWPKDYEPGTFINNWQVGIDEVPEESEVSPPDVTGAASIERLSHLGRWQVGHQFYFVNNIIYAKALEEGWSPQAPSGMVGLTVLEFPQIVADVHGKYANKRYAGF
jgi:hypothetical protein